MLDAEIAKLRQNLGGVLRDLREERGMSKLSVARHVGETLRTVDGWEDGTGHLTFEDIVRLGRLYDVRLSEIVTRAGS